MFFSHLRIHDSIAMAFESDGLMEFPRLRNYCLLLILHSMDDFDNTRDDLQITCRQRDSAFNNLVCISDSHSCLSPVDGV